MPRLMPNGSVRDLRLGTSSHEVRLFEVTRRDGVVLRFAESDLAIVYGGQTFQPTGGMSSSAIAYESKLERDDADLQGFIDSDAITQEDLAAGKYRDAQIAIIHVDARWPFLGAIETDVFYLGAVKRDGEIWSAQVESLAQRMRQKVGRTVSRRCPWEVGDSDCTKDLTAFTETISITVVEDLTKRLIFRASGLSSTLDDYYRHGYVTITSGPNAGERRKVNRSFGTTKRIILQEPFGFDLSAGVTFSIHRGCNGLAATCRTIFNNIAFFGGLGLFSPGANALFKNPNLKKR